MWVCAMTMRSTMFYWQLHMRHTRSLDFIPPYFGYKYVHNYLQGLLSEVYLLTQLYLYSFAFLFALSPLS